MKMHFKGIAMMLILIMVIAMVGCGQQANEPAGDTSTDNTPVDKDDPTMAYDLNKTGRTLKIGATLPNYNIVHWVNMVWEWERLAKANNVEFTFVHAGGYENVEKQINQVQDFIAAGYDGIMVGAVDAQALVQVIDKAAEQGIIVVDVNNITKSTKSYAKVKSDDFGMGMQVADLLAEGLGQEGKVVMLNAPAGSTPTLRGQGFRARIQEKYPNIEILDEKLVESDPAKATATMEDLIQTYPEIDGVFSWGDTMTVAAASVLASQNNKALISGIDIANPGVRDGLRNGTIHSIVAQQPIMIAKVGFEYVMKGINGEPNNDTREFIPAPSLVVTSENIDTVDHSGVLQPTEKW